MFADPSSASNHCCSWQVWTSSPTLHNYAGDERMLSHPDQLRLTLRTVPSIDLLPTNHSREFGFGSAASTLGIQTIADLLPPAIGRGSLRPLRPPCLLMSGRFEHRLSTLCIQGRDRDRSECLASLARKALIAAGAKQRMEHQFPCVDVWPKDRRQNVYKAEKILGLWKHDLR